MKFTKYTPRYYQNNFERMVAFGQTLLGRKATPIEAIEAICSHYSSNKPDDNTNEIFLATVYEVWWNEARRPFFNVHKAALEGLISSRTNLNVRPSEIPLGVVHDLESIEVRTPEGLGIPPFIVTVMPGNVVTISIEGAGPSGIAWDEPFDVLLANSERHPTEAVQLTTRLTKLAVGVLLLAADPDYIEPVLLNADKGVAPEKREAAAAKARRRGVIGYDIGRNIETSPHYRRAHFSTRWTGKGRTKPRLVLIDGTIVNRKKLTEVPTGFEGKR